MAVATCLLEIYLFITAIVQFTANSNNTLTKAKAKLNFFRPGKGRKKKGGGKGIRKGAPKAPKNAQKRAPKGRTEKGRGGGIMKIINNPEKNPKFSLYFPPLLATIPLAAQNS